jgi:hypothetical protein
MTIPTCSPPQCYVTTLPMPRRPSLSIHHPITKSTQYLEGGVVYRSTRPSNRYTVSWMERTAARLGFPLLRTDDRLLMVCTPGAGRIARVMQYNYSRELFIEKMNAHHLWERHRKKHLMASRSPMVRRGEASLENHRMLYTFLSDMWRLGHVILRVPGNYIALQGDVAESMSIEWSQSHKSNLDSLPTLYLPGLDPDSAAG